MPRLSVFACFLCPATEQIMLVHQRGGRWSLPGGRCNPSEKPMTALRREVREETTYVLPSRIQPAQTWEIRRPWRKHRRPAAVFLFRERPETMAATEIDAVRWFSLEAIPTPITRTALAAVHECLQLSPELTAQIA